MRDDEDDTMAANPEPPRIATGYADTTAPRSRKPRGERAGRWEVVFVDGKDAGEAPVIGGKQCRGCPAVVAILHSIAPGIRREYCGECQGRSHR